MLETHLIIGEVLKPQGVKGELKVKPITADPMRFEGLRQVYLKGADGAFTTIAVRVTRIELDAVYLLFEGVKDRSDAEKMRGQLLYVDRAHAIKLPKDAAFICDLIGCRGVDDHGAEVGVLTDVMQPGACDVYVFKGEKGEVLVPALKRAVIAVDVEAKQITLSRQALQEVAVFEDR